MRSPKTTSLSQPTSDLSKLCELYPVAARGVWNQEGGVAWPPKDRRKLILSRYSIGKKSKSKDYSFSNLLLIHNELPSLRSYLPSSESCHSLISSTIPKELLSCALIYHPPAALLVSHTPYSGSCPPAVAHIIFRDLRFVLPIRILHRKSPWTPYYPHVGTETSLTSTKSIQNLDHLVTRWRHDIGAYNNIIWLGFFAVGPNPVDPAPEAT